MKFNKKIVFFVLFLIGIFVIFFVGREFDSQTSKRHFVITSDGINQFRKGLDVSGGTKLIYKISYDKYEKLYNNPAELNAVKKTIETIILKKIDGRISKLGVSDYIAYVQTMDNEPYIVVEIGGVADLDQAKEIIGKTVELEFRMPNKEAPSAETVKIRGELAQKILSDVEKAPGAMERIAANRGGENVFYNHFTGVTIEQLPDFYRNNSAILDSLKTGELYNKIQDGLYASISTKNASGTEIKEDLKGFTFFRLIDKKEEKRSFFQPQDIIQTAKQYGLEYKQDFTKTESAVKVGEYKYEGNSLIYNIGSIASGQKAYDIVAYAVNQPNMIGKSSKEVEDIEAKTKSLIEKVKSNIKKGSIVEDEYVKKVNDGWIEEKEFAAILSSFSGQDLNTVKEYSQLNSSYIVFIREQKLANESLFASIRIDGITNKKRDAMDSSLKTKVLYDIEDVFVQDKEGWILAQDKNGKVLNGAYFKYSNTSTSQVGEAVVVINFDDMGKDIFCSITESSIGNQMAIFVGGKLLTSPTIQSKICGGTAEINGSFTMESAKQLSDSLNDGAMPAPLVLMQEGKISPTLGVNALTGSLRAGLIGAIGIIVFIWSMYGLKKAFITIGVLIMFMTFLLTFMKLTDYSLSLSSIAAIILAIGMGVDANILIYERLREELRDGKSIDNAIHLANTRSRTAIRDGQISTGLIALLLVGYGINIFKGFGSMMIVTVLLVLIVNVQFSVVLLELAYTKKNSK